MKLHNLEGRSKTGYTTWGCLWDQGACKKNTAYRLKREDGTRAPMQTRVTAWWPDGSVKWTAHTARADGLGACIEVLKEEDGAQKEEREKDRLIVKQQEESFRIEAGALTLSIPGPGDCLFDQVWHKGGLRVGKACPVLILERPVQAGGLMGTVKKEYRGLVEKVSFDEEGPLRAVVKYQGIHVAEDGERRFPFLIRMNVGYCDSKLSFTHTFLYDGDEDRDFLKGIGLELKAFLEGEIYNRHVMFEGDAGVFHEAAAQLLTWRPRVPEEIYKAQMEGQRLPVRKEAGEAVEKVLSDMPFWDEYRLCQDSPSHFRIRKKTSLPNCCLLDSLHGYRTNGGAAFGGENGSLAFSFKDFWQTYPSGYTFSGLTGEEVKAVIWLYSPETEAMDFRHYTNRGYNQVYYEGYDYKGATPYGIASTSQYSVSFLDTLIPSWEELMKLSKEEQAPAQYVGDPKFYHEKRAFGYWSLPKQNTELERWLEEQLDQAVAFYEGEAERRNWYGLFNYGDFMHTYDKERHQWRYDMGGYAWDNTELVPTLWLWLAFLRTGREDIFSLAEKLTRHTSEVDVYHMGRYKGLGSRHNVRHWGCPCKEARIAMAAHHRYYYYLTGDYRLEDIFDELKDNEQTFLKRDPLGDFYTKEEMIYKSHARSGPDWSSLCANWMTQWERKQDERYKKKIETGIADIKKAPLKLVSGPDFEFDPQTVHLRYIGERAAGGTHLQICMGAPQVWMELTDLLENEEWKQMLAEYGRFYYLPREEQLLRSKGIIGDRKFSLPFMAAAMGAYGAWYFKDEELAKTTWSHLLGALLQEGQEQGFEGRVISNKGNHKKLFEIPWITTNFTAQWCLNVICVLEFIRDQLPKTLKEGEKLAAEQSLTGFHKA